MGQEPDLFMRKLVDSQFGEHRDRFGTNCDGAPRARPWCPRPRRRRSIRQFRPSPLRARPSPRPAATRWPIDSVRRIVVASRSSLTQGQAVWIPCPGVLISYALEPVVAFSRPSSATRRGSADAPVRSTCRGRVCAPWPDHCFVNRLPSPRRSRSIQNLTHPDRRKCRRPSGARISREHGQPEGSPRRRHTVHRGDVQVVGCGGVADAVEFGSDVRRAVLVHLPRQAISAAETRAHRSDLSSKKITVEILTEINRQIDSS